MPKFKNEKTEYIQTDISLEKLAANWKGHKGCSIQNLKRRSTGEGWVELRDQFQTLARLKSNEKAADTLAEMNVQLIKSWQMVRRKADVMIAFDHFADIDEASKGLKLADEGERRARGEHQDDDIPKLKVILVHEKSDK
jgi:hypothetical protein